MRAKRIVRARRRLASSLIVLPSPKHDRAERIRHHQATFIGDQHARKVVWHGKVKAIREVTVGAPFAVGAKIGHGRFDLDDHEVARLAESENIGAAAVGEREFHQAHVSEVLQGAADAARQKGGTGRLDDGCSHDELGMIRRIIGQGETDGGR